MKIDDVVKNIREAQHNARNNDTDGSEKTEQTLLWVLSLLTDVEVGEFKVGDVVHLKTGSPKMIILQTYETEAQVLWHPFGTNEIKRDNVPYIALRKHT